MKNIKLTLLLVLTVLSNMIYGQFQHHFYLNFDNQQGLENVFIDTISSEENVWEIGTPDKVSLNGAYSPHNAICTDLHNPYPPKDTSSFTISTLATNAFEDYYSIELSGRYKVDTDSLNDYGIIEFSPDNGGTWIDLMNDTLYLQKECYGWYTGKPVFTGKTKGWEYFKVYLTRFIDEFDINYNDTVLYRFTFISDSIHTGKEGWLIDDIIYEETYESLIERKAKSFESEVFPNPASNLITIRFPNESKRKFYVYIFNSEGRIIKVMDTNSNTVEFDLTSVRAGQHYYLIKYEHEQSSGKFIIM